MKKQWKLIIAFICAMLLTVAVAVIMIVPGQDAELNIDETRKSVVAIVSGVDVEREILTSDVIVGTGFCYEPGMVITNYHNVQNGDENITLITYDDTVISAKIVAKDEQNDIALLQIDHDLPHLILRSSENCAQGDEVMSISTPISAYLRGTYSKGYITNKDVVGFGSQRLLQSNIELSPGCSGAPLLDSDGCVLGMVTFKSTEFGAEGLGFAIPGERLLQMIDRLEQEIVTPDLMIEFENDIYQKFGIPGATGLTVQAIGDDSPVSGDLQVGDKLIEVNGQSVTGIIEYTEQLEQVSADEDIVLTVIRDAQKTTIIVER